jgi:endoglucanase Acf2
LAAIAFAVALLWGCVIGERNMEKRATLDRARILRDIKRLQHEQQVQPASMPSLLRPRPVRVTTG